MQKIIMHHYYLIGSGTTRWGAYPTYTEAFIEAGKYKLKHPDKKVEIVEVIEKRRRFKVL